MGSGPRPATATQCAREVVVPAVRLEPVRVDDVDVDPVRLTRERVGGSVDVITGDDRRSYVAPGDVLFATDQATLRPAATRALRTIADLVRPTSGTVTVEGHTDDRGSDAYNLALSKRRAEAVVRWLQHGGARPGIPPRRSSPAGESAPAVAERQRRAPRPEPPGGRVRRRVLTGRHRPVVPRRRPRPPLGWWPHRAPRGPRPATEARP